MKYPLKYIIGAIVFILTSCEKEAIDVDIPIIDPKLVIQSYISPQDTLIVVHVSNSKPVFGKPDQSAFYVNNAIVSLSDGTSSINLEYNGFEEGNQFTVDAELYPINPGKTYYLTVTTSDGRKAEAVCTVPVSAPAIESFKIDSAEVNHTYPDGYTEQYKKFLVSYNFNDKKNQENFYRMAGFKTIFYGYDDDVYPQQDELYFEENDFFTDNGKDGTQISFYHLEIFRLYNSENIKRPITGEFYLLTTDRHYYEYHRTFNGNDNENPFAEPTQVYSNINGGLGVFSAYNVSVVSFSF